VISVTNNNASGYYSRDVTKTFSVVPPSRIYELRAKHPSEYLPYYAIDFDGWAKYLRFAANFSASDPGSLQLVYRVSIPDYKTEDESWLEDEYDDLYFNTIMKHAAIFVREEDRVALFKSLADEAFMNADMDDKHSKAFSGSPLQMQPHHKVP